MTEIIQNGHCGGWTRHWMAITLEEIPKFISYGLDLKIYLAPVIDRALKLALEECSYENHVLDQSKSETICFEKGSF